MEWQESFCFAFLFYVCWIMSERKSYPFTLKWFIRDARLEFFWLEAFLLFPFILESSIRSDLWISEWIRLWKRETIQLGSEDFDTQRSSQEASAECGLFVSLLNIFALNSCKTLVSDWMEVKERRSNRTGSFLWTVDGFHQVVCSKEGELFEGLSGDSKENSWKMLLNSNSALPN